MLAFTFPGQGSQRPGMGRPWLDHPSWELVGDASDAAGRDVAALLLDADADELKATRNAQLATFTLSLVVLDAVERLGVEPSACAGHSLGEYTALVASGALAFEDGVRLVAERGDAMQDAADSQPGTMAALMGIEDADADAACQRAEGDVWVANFNAPGQVVIAGTDRGVEAASGLARSLGARKALPIPVSGAFHTPLMSPARDRLRKGLSNVSFRTPEVPVVANVDGRTHTDSTEWPGLLSAQLCSPVRWRQCLATLFALGPSTFVELGPGGVLTGLVRRTLGDATAVAVGTPDGLDELVGVIAGDTPLHSFAATHHGERLYVSERLVVSPASGLFRPNHDCGEGDGAGPTAPAESLPAGPAIGAEPPAEARNVEVGGLIGRVGGTEVRTPFAGALMGLLVIPGERVTEGQPVAWLRTPHPSA